MQKYFKISIDPLVTTFSRIESGRELLFNLKVDYQQTEKINNGDMIIISLNDKVFYNLVVLDKFEDEIRLKKIFEIEKDLNLNIENIGVFELIEKKEFDSICRRLFLQYIDLNNVADLNEFKEENSYYKKNLNKSLNQIFYGPPGTGKTYNSINKALEIIDSKIDLNQKRSIIKSEYEKF